jgi:hypothetical protein
MFVYEETLNMPVIGQITDNFGNLDDRGYRFGKDRL